MLCSIACFTSNPNGSTQRGSETGRCRWGVTAEQFRSSALTISSYPLLRQAWLNQVGEELLATNSKVNRCCKGRSVFTPN